MTVPANVTRFLFQIPSLPEALRVVGFDIKAAVSDVFTCDVELACENPALKQETLVGKNGLLTLFNERHPQYLHGEIQHLQQGESGHRYTLYRVRLRVGGHPTFWPPHSVKIDSCHCLRGVQA